MDDVSLGRIRQKKEEAKLKGQKRIKNNKNKLQKTKKKLCKDKKNIVSGN